jgi:hypothetical protein
VVRFFRISVYVFTKLWDVERSDALILMLPTDTELLFTYSKTEEEYCGAMKRDE